MGRCRFVQNPGGLKRAALGRCRFVRYPGGLEGLFWGVAVLCKILVVWRGCYRSTFSALFYFVVLLSLVSRSSYSSMCCFIVSRLLTCADCQFFGFHVLLSFFVVVVVGSVFIFVSQVVLRENQ